MSDSRRNFFKKAGAAVAAVAAAPIMRHSDVLALDSPDKAEEFAQIQEYSLDRTFRSPAVCPTCLAPAAAIVQMINHPAYVMRCNRSHVWKIDDLTIARLPGWMQSEWDGAVRMAKVMPPDRETIDAARRLQGTVNAQAWADEHGL